ncbi:hypothetical protein EMPG_10198 [Blastomyces silverae]|uniref:Uncharacterized protein n=1 Tax=Blastomyces silverae TaxID=2060906 RepID=A0A0H1B4N0_9EURO|nr:hypothetical protein EMPG_10198 [Blastomyces silverae]
MLTLQPLTYIIYHNVATYYRALRQGHTFTASAWQVSELASGTSLELASFSCLPQLTFEVSRKSTLSSYFQENMQIYHCGWGERGDLQPEAPHVLVRLAEDHDVEVLLNLDQNQQAQATPAVEAVSVSTSS